MDNSVSQPKSKIRRLAPFKMENRIKLAIVRIKIDVMHLESIKNDIQNNFTLINPLELIINQINVKNLYLFLKLIHTNTSGGASSKVQRGRQRI